MTLTRLAVQRPVGVTVAVLALLLLAAATLRGVGLDLLPDLEFPLAAVVTAYPGADPETVEADITRPLEDGLATVPGVKQIRSVSMENVSLILIDFDWGTDLDEGLREVEMNLAAVHKLLPQAVEEPIVLRADPAQFPVMLVAVSGPSDPVEVTERVRSRVLPRLQQLPGVASVNILGGEYEEISIRYDSQALAEHGLTPTLLHQIIAYQNTVVPAGPLTEKDVRYRVKAGNRIESLEQLRNQTVALREPESSVGLLGLTGALPVRLRDVADVRVAPRPREGVTRVNGQPAVVLRVLKQSGENSMMVANRVRNELRALEEDPSVGLTFFKLTDQSDLIGSSLRTLATMGTAGAVLAVLVLLLFLKSVGSLAVIGAAIPLSILAALLILSALGVTLNQMSLGGLALAVGMLVDNAIVVLENIVRHRRLGKGPREAAVDGGQEIGPAVIASTITTVVVFVPILFVDSLAGRLFHDMGLAVSAALVSSLLVALTVIPSAAARWIVRSDKEAGDGPGREHPLADTQKEAAPAADLREESEAGEKRDALGKAGEPGGFARFRRRYEELLGRWIRRGWATPAATIAFVLLLSFLPSGLESQFLPPTDGGIITAELNLPPGTTSERAIAEAKRLERQILDLPQVDTVAVMAGDQGSDDFFSLVEGASVDRVDMTVVLVPRGERNRSAAEVARAIAAMPRSAESQLTLQADRTGAALGDDFFPGVTLEIRGPDYDTLRRLSNAATAALEKMNGFGAVTSTLTAPYPEVFFDVTERSFQGALTGGEPLTAGQVGLAVRNHLTGTTSTRISVDGVRLPVVLRPESTETESIASLEALRIPGSQMVGESGSRPVLGRIASVKRREAPTSIHHSDRIRMATVRAELDGIGLNEARKRAAEALRRIEIPAGYDIRIAGIHQVIDESAQELVWVLLVAVGLVYVVMAAQFESFVQPLIILIAVPLAAVGALAGLRLTGHAINVPSAIGLILLVGIAVNNGIVMVDYINRLRRNGRPLADAVIQGASVRLRPILMTAITSLFGLLPLAVGRGDGSELQAPMAVAVIGGLVTSTLLTLFVVPGWVVLFSRRHNREDGPGLRPVAMTIALVVFGLATLPPSGAWAAPAFKADILAALHVENEAAPRVWTGVGGSWQSPPFTLAGRIAAPVDAPSEAFVEASSRISHVGPSAAYALSFTAGAWLPDGAGRRMESEALWRTPSGQTRLTLTHNGDARRVHPWSGNPPLWSGWRLHAVFESPVRPHMDWVRTASLLTEADSAPRWLLLSGPTWDAGAYRTLVHAGLILEDGTYAPLIRLGAAVSLLPQGEIDFTAGPVFGTGPPDWSLAGLGYRGSLGPVQADGRLEWGGAGSQFSRRAYLRLHLRESRTSVLLTWIAAPDQQVNIALQKSF